jgi:hypothetical protein
MLVCARCNPTWTAPKTGERPDTWVTVCTGHLADTSSSSPREEEVPWKEC